MRKVFWLLVLAAIAAGLFWLVSSIALGRALSGWFDQRRAAGWVAEYSGLKTRGFPLRFDTVISDLELADPATGLAWSAPEFRFLAPAYRPGDITAIWPGSQSIATPDERISIASGTMQAAILFTETSDFNIAALSATLEEIALASTLGWTSALAAGHLEMQQVAADTNSYEVHFEASDLQPASGFLRRLEDIAFLSDRIERFSLAARISFDAPWNRYAVERARPQITRIELELMQAGWGELELWLAGNLEVDAAGTPTGQITVKARNWREIVALAMEVGALSPAIEPSLVQALSFLSTLSGDKTTLDTPLIFRGGYVAFGPIPLGLAPDLTIR